LLHPDDPKEISSRMEKAKDQRMASQPHGARSAGCFFKNAPASPIGTGKMIDDLGMKGTRRGGAVVSPKHANFIVTEGEDAKAADALALAEEIRGRVKQEHGIDLNTKLSCGARRPTHKLRVQSSRFSVRSRSKLRVEL